MCPDIAPKAAGDLDPRSILDIVHEDPEFVVVNKVSGMLSVPGRGPEKTDCVSNRV